MAGWATDAVRLFPGEVRMNRNQFADERTALKDRVAPFQEHARQQVINGIDQILKSAGRWIVARPDLWPEKDSPQLLCSLDRNGRVDSVLSAR
jgi:hypothetical protein